MIKKTAFLSIHLNRKSHKLLLLIVLVLNVCSFVTESSQADQDAGSADLKLKASLNAFDSDGDDLSDFQEVYKYLTDPMKMDTDGDGLPDGDWNERREYTYSVRSILRFMPPLDKNALNDDYQDAQVIKETDDYIEIEVIHYPLATPYESIEENPNWQQDYAGMMDYLRPGVTTNWDTKMRQDLLTELKADGIIIDKLMDKQVVKKVSSWLMEKSRYLDKIFTTYYIYFPNAQPKVYPGLEDAFENEFGRDKENYDWTIDQHLEHELLGKGMFYNKTHGSCTSFAVYLTTALRALGIPTRMVIVAPVVDASDKEQLHWVKDRITHNKVREIMLAGLRKSDQGFTAHTFNEVYVGKRWHRLNYKKLGQTILDEQCFGLHTHLYTFNDLSEANLAPTWGLRYGKGIRSDIFENSNPYSTIELSDLFGCHSNISNPIVHIKEHKKLTISKAYWFHSSERPRRIPNKAVPKDNNGHILFHIDEWFEGKGIGQYESFYDMADKNFFLKAQEHPDVHAKAERGYWNQEFYIRIPEQEYVKMEKGVLYTIHPVNSHPKYRWRVSEGVTIRKSNEIDHQKSTPLPNIFILCPLSIPVFEEIIDIVKLSTRSKTGRYHSKKSYDEIFDGTHNKKSGDIIVLLFSLDTDDHIPAEYEDLLPVAWPAIESALKQRKTLELKSTAREMNIIVLAAPTAERLRQLVRESNLLSGLKGSME